MAFEYELKIIRGLVITIIIRIGPSRIITAHICTYGLLPVCLANNATRDNPISIVRTNHTRTHYAHIRLRRARTYMYAIRKTRNSRITDVTWEISGMRDYTFSGRLLRTRLDDGIFTSDSAGAEYGKYLCRINARARAPVSVHTACRKGPINHTDERDVGRSWPLRPSSFSSPPLSVQYHIFIIIFIYLLQIFARHYEYVSCTFHTGCSVCKETFDTCTKCIGRFCTRNEHTLYIRIRIVSSSL